MVGRVRVLDGATGDELADLTPFGSGYAGGVRVALAYVDDDARADIVAGTGPGGPATVRVFSGATGAQLPPPLGEYTPFGTGTGSTGGVFVAASNDPNVVVPVFDRYSLLEDTPNYGSGQTYLIFHRTGDLTDPLTISFTIGGTATGGTDYSGLASGTAGFAAGAAESSAINITIIDDTLVEGDETITATVTAGTGYGPGSPGTDTMVIVDDDATSPPPPRPRPSTGSPAWRTSPDRSRTSPKTCSRATRSSSGGTTTTARSSASSSRSRTTTRATTAPWARACGRAS